MKSKLRAITILFIIFFVFMEKIELRRYESIARNQQKLIDLNFNSIKRSFQDLDAFYANEIYKNMLTFIMKKNFKNHNNVSGSSRYLNKIFEKEEKFKQKLMVKTTTSQTQLNSNQSEKFETKKPSFMYHRFG
jgi:hypothetical protein